MKAERRNTAVITKPISQSDQIELVGAVAPAAGMTLVFATVPTREQSYV